MYRLSDNIKSVVYIVDDWGLGECVYILDMDLLRPISGYVIPGMVRVRVFYVQTIIWHHHLDIIIIWHVPGEARLSIEFSI